MNRWTRGWLAGAVLLSQGCAQASDGSGAVLAPLETLHVGSQCGDLNRPAVIWIADAGEWRQRYAEITRLQMHPPPLPVVDFSREGVLLIAMGQQTTGGYGLSLVGKSATVHDEVLSVAVTWREPLPGYAQTQAMTNPCLLTKLSGGVFSRIRVIDQDGRIRLEGFR
ncbi:MAG: protease complex subunit PrcB family protein [Gammaproteobacteria bacterium]|nr:protease complex subunit PrcB family protein [Gammaproteobacteria bacterium]